VDVCLCVCVCVCECVWHRGEKCEFRGEGLGDGMWQAPFMSGEWTDVCFVCANCECLRSY
jgi:hypothetical protein